MGKGSGLKAAYTRAKEDLMPEISYIDGMRPTMMKIFYSVLRELVHQIAKITTSL